MVAQTTAPQTAAPVNPLVMKVNGDPVYAAEISLMMQNIQGYLASQGQQVTQEQVFQVASQRIVEQKLLAQEAERFGLKPDETRVAEMMQLTEQQAGGRASLETMMLAAGTDHQCAGRNFSRDGARPGLHRATDPAHHHGDR